MTESIFSNKHPCWNPSWWGCTGTVGYVARKSSTTSILKDILALRRHGVPVRVYSILPPARDVRTPPGAEALLGQLEVLPEPGHKYIFRFVSDYFDCLDCRPGATLRETTRTLLWPTRRSFRRFSRAIALASFLRHDRIAHIHAAEAQLASGVVATAARLTGIPWSRRAGPRFFSEERYTRVAARLSRRLAIERVLYICADRGLAVRGPSSASVQLRLGVAALRQHGVRCLLLATRFGLDNSEGIAARLVRTGVRGRWKARIRMLARRVPAGHPLEQAIVGLIDVVMIYSDGLRQARLLRPDVVYERYSPSAFAGAMLARRLGIPHILEVNAPVLEVESRFFGVRLPIAAGFTERWLLRSADRVVVTSPALSRYVQNLGIARERILTPSAVDSDYSLARMTGQLMRDSARSARSVPEAADAGTWTELSRRLLAETEKARREHWKWGGPCRD